LVNELTIALRQEVLRSSRAAQNRGRIGELGQPVDHLRVRTQWRGDYVGASRCEPAVEQSWSQ